MNYNTSIIIILGLILFIIAMQLVKYNVERLTNVTSESETPMLTTTLIYPVQKLLPQPDNTIPINEIYFTYGPTLTKELEMIKSVTIPPHA